MRVGLGLVIHGSLIKDIHLRFTKTQKINRYLFNKSKHYFILILTIKYLWKSDISDSSIALKSTEKSYIFSLRETALMLLESVYQICFLDKIESES